MNYTDSICATVHYVVEGDIPGSTNINALNFDDDANVDNKVYVKAVLQTENQFKSPRIDSIQVRVI